jgi:hypothetical protein
VRVLTAEHTLLGDDGVAALIPAVAISAALGGRLRAFGDDEIPATEEQVALGLVSRHLIADLRVAFRGVVNASGKLAGECDFARDPSKLSRARCDPSRAVSDLTASLACRLQDDLVALLVRFNTVTPCVKGNGKVIEMGLGAADAVTLAAARDKRKRLGERVEEGLNPLAKRRKKQDQQDARRTFAEAGEAYIAREATSLHVDEIVLADVKQVIQPLVDRG